MGGTEVVEAKDGAGSATLSMAFAAAEFGQKVLMGLSGVKQVGYCYINQSYEGVDYFSMFCDFGPGGIAYVHPIEGVTPYEKKRLDAAKNKLRGDIKAGKDF